MQKSLTFWDQVQLDCGLPQSGQVTAVTPVEVRNAAQGQPWGKASSTNLQAPEQHATATAKPPGATGEVFEPWGLGFSCSLGFGAWSFPLEALGSRDFPRNEVHPATNRLRLKALQYIFGTVSATDFASRLALFPRAELVPCQAFRDGLTLRKSY